MAFSFDPDGGIAVARILSDHPEDNGKLVYLHVHYTPALDDAWYDQANDPYDAALPISLSRAAPTVPNPGFAQPAGGTTSSNEVKTESRRGQAPGSRGNNALHRRKRPQTTPASNVTETPEAPDTEYPFPAAIQPTTGSGAGGAVLRGGAFGDEAPSSHSSGSSSGSGSGAAGGGRAASEGSGSGSGGNAATAASVGSGMMVPHGILKRKRIHFDPLEPCDEKGEAVPPRRKQRLEGKSEQKYDFPPPPKHPDDMTDAEFDKWTETLTDAEYDEFERYMDDLDAESDAEIDEESEDYDMEDYRITTPVVEYSRAPPVPALPAPKRPKPIIPIATNPNPTAPVGTRANPVSLLGADYFQVGSRERKQIGDKELKQMTAQLAYGPQHQPSYQGPKAEVMKRVHHEAIRDSERRQMGKEIELFGGDCFRCGLCPRLLLLHMTG